MADLINRYPDRFLFGTDEVGPTEQGKYLTTYDIYQPLFAQADAGREAEAAQGQLRAAVRRGSAEGAGVGEGAREGAKGQGARQGNDDPRDHEQGAVHMNQERRLSRRRIVVMAVALVLLACVPGAWAQDAAKAPAAETKPSMTIYGFAMLDIGQNFTQIHPDWYDTMRVSKLPSYDKQYGEDGVAFAGVRQTRLGVKTSSPTRSGRAEDAVRVRALRHRRRFRPDDVPTAARLRRTGRVRRRPDLEPVHGSGRVPELARVPGARPAWCSSATCRCAGCRSRATRT